MKITDGLREQIRASISNSYYDARNAGRTMTEAAEAATARIEALLDKAPLEKQDGSFLAIEKAS